jgi:hypothetical protein
MSAARIASFRQALANARSRGDASMVRCMKIELGRLGVGETAVEGPLETVTPEPMENTMADRPRRGRRPMPRCEHNQIAERCDICNQEEHLSAVTSPEAVTD